MTSESPKLEDLIQSFPAATFSECRRFLYSFPKDVEERLSTYLKWRELHGIDISSDPKTCDSDDWSNASKKAITFHSSAEESSLAYSADHRYGRPNLRGKIRQKDLDLYRDCIPQLLYGHSASTEEPLKDTTGHRILHCLPALISLNTRYTVETFITALALYLDSKFDRSNEEQITIVVDVRPGRGWPNPPALHMVRFIRQLTRGLYELHPGRLYRCVIYPVPTVALHIWNLVRRWLDPMLTERIILVVGGADLESATPVAKLSPFIDHDGLERIESARLAAFV